MYNLTAHTKIGIDFDKTLVFHKNSHILQKYILENFKNKSFYIITFRSHGLEDQIKYDLLGNSNLTLEMFKGVHCIPYNIYEGAIRSDAYIYEEPFKYWDEPYTKYMEWKGKICKELNCTILVDDNKTDVIYGCRKHGIKFLNIDEIRAA